MHLQLTKSLKFLLTTDICIPPPPPPPNSDPPEGRTLVEWTVTEGPRGVRCKRLELTINELLREINAERDSFRGTCENH